MLVNKRTDKGWTSLRNKINKGDILKGKVTKVEPCGVFLDIGFVFDGLLLVPHMSSTPYKSLEDYPKLGEELEVVVIDFEESVEMEHRYISLSRLEKHF